MKNSISKGYSYLVLLILTLLAFGLSGQTPGELVNQLESEKNDTLRINLYNKLFLSYEYSDTLQARVYLHNALFLASKLQYKPGLAETYKYIGYFLEDQGNYQGALANYERVYKLSLEMKDTAGVANTYNLMGSVFINQGYYIQAIENLRKGLKIAERNNINELLGKLNNNLGICYQSIKKYELAHEHYNNIIEMARETGNKRWLAIGLDNIGVAYQYLLETDKALESHTQSLELRLELGDKMGVASCYENLGVVYARKFEKDLSNDELLNQALENYNKALDIFEELEIKRKISNCLFNISLLYRKMNNIDAALEFVRKSHQINLELGGYDDLMSTYEEMSSDYQQLGMFEEAYKNHVLYKTMYDSLTNVTNVKKITQIEMQAEFEKKEKMVALEKQQNELLYMEEQKRTNFIIYSLFGGLVLVILLVFVVLRSNNIKRKTNLLLEKQKNEIELKNTEITDSIKYAKHIQEAVFPQPSLVKKCLPHSFIYYKPKDIVSGDFFWMCEFADKVLFAVVDCTGHGVPGALISIVGDFGLKRAVNEFKLTKPSAILDKLNEVVNSTLRQTFEESKIRDGMDIAICCFDKKKKVLEYAGAFNPLLIIRKGNLIEIKADKQAVGQFMGELKRGFSNHVVELQNNDMIYMFTDGFADQFGGKNPTQRQNGGRKFKSNQFRQLLVAISELGLDEQYIKLDEVFHDWKGELDQIDDICIMGIRI